LPTGRSGSASFDDLGAFYSGTINVTSGERPDRYSGGFLTGNALAILGVQPTLGRGFTPDDSRPGAPATLLLGQRAWRDHYGSDPAVLGRNGEDQRRAGHDHRRHAGGFLFPRIRKSGLRCAPIRSRPRAAKDPR
jgi:hypothetical protein